MKDLLSITPILGILAAGIALSLVVQPPPPTYAAGWSEARFIDSIECSSRYQALVTEQDRIHLIWQKEVARRQQVFYAQVDYQGGFAVEPTRLSHPDVEAVKPSMILTGDDVAACLWIERDAASHTLLIRRLRDVPKVLATTTTFMEGAAISADDVGNIYVIWTNRRQGSYEVNLAKLDNQGNVIFADRHLTISPVFKYEPIVAAGRDLLNILYFEDDGFSRKLVHRIYSPDGNPITEPQVTISEKSRGEGSPIAIDTDMDDNLFLFGARWGNVVYIKIDSRTREIVPPRLVLTDVPDYSQMSLATDDGVLELVWTATKRYKPQLQIYHIQFDARGNPLSQENRLTHSHTSALRPVFRIDHGGSKHLFWQEYSEKRACSLVYMNDTHPASISNWQRLGFSGGNAWLSFLYVLASSLLVTLVAMAVNVGKLIIAGTATVLFCMGVARPLHLKSLWIPLIVLLAVLGITMRPVGSLVGQASVDITQAAHWVFFSTATLTVLCTVRIWRIEPSDALAWGGASLSWIYIYYFLNTVLFLREVFAP